MKSIVLSIKGTQEVDGQNDVTEFMSDGEYEYTDNKVEILYDESVTLGIDGIKTRLTVNGDGVITLVRNNGEYGNLVIEEGKRHLCQYYTAYGNIMIGIYGNKVENKLNENGGELTLIYSIDVNSGLLSRNKVEIKVGEENK